MQTVFLAITLSLLTTLPPPERLRRYDPQLQISKSAEERVAFEKSIPLAKRRALTKYLSEHFNESTSQIYKMPLAENLYLALVQDYSESQNIFLLLKSEGETISEINRVNPDVGCLIPTPTFFNGNGRTLIILAIAAADGGYCGNYLLEYKEQSLKYLGDISAYDAVHGKGGFQGHSPIENLTTVEFKQDTYYVTIRGRGNLYGGAEDKRLARARTPITYVYDGKEFRLSPTGQRK